MKSENSLFNDEIDLSTILSILFDNFNLLLSILLTSTLVVSIFYLTSTKLYLSETLLEVKSEKNSFLPSSLTNFSSSNSEGGSSLDAEVAIYKSKETVSDALINLEKSSYFKDLEIPLSVNSIRGSLTVNKSSDALMSVSFVSADKQLSQYLLDLLNEEYIKDRKNFIKQSSTAGRNFVSQEIPRIKLLLEEAEENLNNFKVSTKRSDVIFDSDNRNFKLQELRNRVNEITFKELELKEFYKENHPIYLTLTEQKKLVMTQIKEIESDLPNIPSTQRTLENFKRDVEIYSNVLKELSSQELSLGMSEASSLSNVRIINEASEAYRVSPKKIIFLNILFFPFLGYIILFIRHFIGNKITNYDALIDYVGKENVLGEFPFIDKNSDNKNLLNISEELLNKTVFEITHSLSDYKTFSIVSSRKDVGKTEIAKRLFNKLQTKYKVCLIDLDYRKKGLTKELYGEKNFDSFEDFEKEKENFTSENGSIFIPSLSVNDPPDFFSSDEFRKYIAKIAEEYDYVICDTPPWKLFVDSKIISNSFNFQIYIACNQLTSFQDIDVYTRENKGINTTKFFFNKFKLYFDFLWLKYQYPYYSKNYYYDYIQYSSFKKDLSFGNFLVKSFAEFLANTKKWLKHLIRRFF